jgi:hypothetical protein
MQNSATKPPVTPILELLMPPEARGFGDPQWRGIEEFPPALRKKMVLDLAAMLRAHSHLDRPVRPGVFYADHDRWIVDLVHDLFESIGANAQLAIPALEEVSRSGELAASNTLFHMTIPRPRLPWKPGRDSKGASSGESTPTQKAMTPPSRKPSPRGRPRRTSTVMARFPRRETWRPT